jgi:hypothetical protein
MKRFVLLGTLLLSAASLILAQDIDQKVRSAVDTLSAGRNRALEVNIEPVTIDGTGTPTALSRYLADKLELYTVSNTLFTVVQPTRGVGQRTGGAQKGKISGTYRKVGSNVEVTLKLIGVADNRTMQMANFSIPISELEKLEIAIVPANGKSEKEVKEREEILSPVKLEETTPAPANNSILTIDAWPNSGTRTYYDGEDLIITLLSNKNCFVKVYHIDVDGKQQMIFPNQIDRENYLRANSELHIPKNSRFVIGPPYGQETIIAVVSGSQFENLESEMVTVVHATRESIEGIISRGVSVEDGRTQNAAANASANTRFTFTILQPGNR